MALSQGLPVFSEECSKCGVDQGVFARKTHKKTVYTCDSTWLGKTTGVGNPLACLS